MRRFRFLREILVRSTESSRKNAQKTLTISTCYGKVIIEPKGFPGKNTGEVTI